MSKFVLDLSPYDVDVQRQELNEDRVINIVTKSEAYPFVKNISSWLRSAGVFKTGEEIVEAVILGKRVLACDADECVLDEREAEILKACVNKFIAATEDGKTSMALGGSIHEEAILRVFGMEEVK